MLEPADNFGEMFQDESASDGAAPILQMTEVGAYEAIQSIQEIIDFEQAEAAEKALPTHQDHMYVQRKSAKCGQCRRYFSTEEDLQAHMTISHSGEVSDRFKCTTCGNGFATKGGLYKHQQIHTGKKQYICNTCNRAFNQLANLHRHNLVHTGEKPYECQTCGKRFSQQTNVNKHQVTHTKIKQFTCHICNNSFTQRANLQKHLMVHSDERPFGCPICLKRYSQESNMKKHMKTHNKSNHSVAYLCAKCQKLFDTVLLFESHLKDCKGTNEDYDFQLVMSDSESTDTGMPKVNVMKVIKSEHANTPMDDESPFLTDDDKSEFLDADSGDIPQYLSEDPDDSAEYLRTDLYPDIDDTLNEPVQYLEQHLV